MTAAPTSYIRSGKVRDLYAIGDDRLLLVASDRLSAFDVVLPTPIPDKGRVLTGLSRFWFGVTRDVIENHVLGTDPAGVPPGVVAPELAADLRGRMLLCRRAMVLPVEVVVRGYISGSGWKEYRASGAVCGVTLPAGLRESDRLPEPILRRYNAEIVKGVQSPEVRAKLEAAGMPVVGTSSEEFARMVREDIETFRKIVNGAGLKPE